MKESYRDYAVLEKTRAERSISAEADTYGRDSHVGSTTTYYKLDYATDTLTEIPSAETADTPYLSGAVREEEDASELFSGNGAVLCFRGNTLQDLSEDAGKGNAIDTVSAAKYSVNGLTVYRTVVYFTQGDVSVPPPYTPCAYYAWIDKGDGVLHQVKSWPEDQILTAVYPYGTNGVYLCSNGRISGSHRLRAKLGLCRRCRRNAFKDLSFCTGRRDTCDSFGRNLYRHGSDERFSAPSDRYKFNVNNGFLYFLNLAIHFIHSCFKSAHFGGNQFSSARETFIT